MDTAHCRKRGETARAYWAGTGSLVVRGSQLEGVSQRLTQLKAVVDAVIEEAVVVRF
jgi:hypothetical protein